jgi:hypothetical protein
LFDKCAIARFCVWRTIVLYGALRSLKEYSGQVPQNGLRVRQRHSKFPLLVIAVMIATFVVDRLGRMAVVIVGSDSRFKRK